MDKCHSLISCVPVILNETMDYRATSSTSVFPMNSEADLSQDSSVSAQGIPDGAQENDYPVHPRSGDGQRLDIWNSQEHH